MFILMAVLTALPAENLPTLGVVPLFPAGEYDAAALTARLGEIYLSAGRFNVVDISSEPGFSGGPETLAYRLREMAAARGIDFFMVLDVASAGREPSPSIPYDSLPQIPFAAMDVSARFYTSDATLIGTLRETMRGEDSPASRTDMALRGLEAIAARSLLEIFPMELTFAVADGPVYTLPAGSDDGITRGMVFSLVARSSGIPQSRSEYEQLRSRGIIQITGTEPGRSRGRLITGRLVEGSTVTAVETSSPANVFLQYSMVPVDIVPGDGLSGDDALENRVMNQVELGGWTSRWGFSFGGALVSGVLPRLSTLGIRGGLGARIPLSSPSLALRLEAGVETGFLIQDTRADSVSASANAVTFAAVAGAGIEWLFSSHLGVQGTLSAVISSSADQWTVQDWRGYNRDALPGELHYAEVSPEILSGRIGLFYMVF
jgi:hypothetical protein